MSEQSWMCSVLHCPDIESKNNIKQGVVNQLIFRVIDQDGKEINIGKVLLDQYLF